MKKSDKIIGICWIINIILLLVIIVIPKDNELLNMLFTPFMLCMFLFPLILIICQCVLRIKNQEEINIYKALPMFGSILIILLSFIRFISMIETGQIFQMVVIIITFILVESLFILLLLKNKEMTKKQYIWLNVGVYVALVLYFTCAMFMSFDYSAGW